jgi:hypothetical protein
MAAAKTVPTDASVPDFLASVPDPRRRADAQAVCDLMTEITGEQPVLWGSSIVGFGTLRWTGANGKESVWMEVGFAPRKAATVLYLMDGYEERADLLARLGPHSIGKSCLYLKRLADVDLGVLTELITASVTEVRGPRFPDRR